MRFPSPLEAALPPECHGWEELYPSHALFAEDRRAFEESRFWFQDAVHYAEPYYPFDAVCLDCTLNGFSQASARLFAVPTSLGLEHRILGGYVYLSPNSITDEATIAERSELFTARGGHYYEHWHKLDAHWREKVQAEIRELDALVVPELPDFENETLVTESRGTGSAHALLMAYDRLLESFDRIGHYHFELVNLGYGAYLALYEECRRTFPDIPDQAIATMVSGIDVVALRPDDELRRLAERAVDLGVAETIKSAQAEEDLIGTLADTRAGDRWLAYYQEAKNPWFYFSYGNGVYHHHRSWLDDPTLPIAMVGSYITRLQAGEDIHRPRDAVLAERDRVTAEYRAVLPAQSCERSTSSSRSPERSFRTSRITTSTLITGLTLCCGTRCGTSASCWPAAPSSLTPKTSFSCVTARSALRSRNCGFIGAPAAQGSLAAPASGPRPSNAANRSSRHCVGGLRRPRSGRHRTR
jgi:pyruvate,water dikinase